MQRVEKFLKGKFFAEKDVPVSAPFIVLDVESRAEGQEILCSFHARSGILEAKVPSDESGLLDYAMVSGRWMPLPQGAVEEAKNILDKLEVKSLGTLILVPMG